MSYIGVQPTAGQYRKLDNISSGFNGSTTSFTTSVSGTNVTAGTAQQLLVSLGGVIQQPDTDYTVSTNTITFTTAPTSGLTFFAVLMGDALNTVTTSDGAITTAKLAGSLSVGLAAGTASAPSLYFTGDTNTGIYSLGADQVAISTGGTGSLFVDASGRVGIGTSSPAQVLDVRSGVARIRLQSSDADSNSEIQYINDARNYSVGINGATDRFRITDETAGVERLTITSAGNVGIGTTSPAEKLHVSTSSGFAGQFQNSNNNATLFIYNTGFSHSRIAFAGSDNTTSVTVGSRGNDLVFDTNGSEKARIDTSGRLLVGTSTTELIGVGSGGAQIQSIAANPLSVARFSNDNFGCVVAIGKSRGASAGSYTVVQNNDLLGEIRFAGADGTDLQTVGAQISAEVDGTPGSNDLPSRLVFSTTADGASSPTERARITNSGYFKASNTGGYYGATSTYHELRSNNNDELIALFTHNGTSGQQYGVVVLTANDQNDATRYFFQCTGGSTVRATIRSNGGLANYQANNVNLSDINTKKDISPAAGTWDCIKEWEIVNYRYKDQPDDADLNLGVIAQQVAESCPEVITVFQEAKEATEDQPAQEEHLGIKEQQMYWMAIKALQEAQVRIEALEAEVAALKAQ